MANAHMSIVTNRTARMSDIRIGIVVHYYVCSMLSSLVQYRYTELYYIGTSVCTIVHARSNIRQALNMYQNDDQIRRKNHLRFEAPGQV